MIKDIKYQGHTATPSDYECMDGELAGCYNLIPEDGALHPIMPPTTKFTLNAGEDLLWIHEMTGHTHYILMVTTTSNNVTTQSLAWVCEENADAVGENPWTRHYITGSTITGTPTIASIGNTLIVNDDNGVQHFLWSTEGSAHYEALGQKPPMLNITFGLHSDFAVWPDTKNTSAFDFKGASFNAMGWDSIIPQLGQDADTSPYDAWAAPQPVMAASADSDIRKWASEYATFSIEGIEGNDDDETYALSNIKSTFTNSVLARVNKFANEKGTEDNKFVMPFFVRYAYRLYDGSYIMHSYPVLMIPNSRGPVFALEGFRGLCLKDNTGHKIDMKMCGRVYGCLSELVYTIGAIPEALANWKDLIQSVDIGVSAPVFTYDQSGYVWGWTNMDQQDAWEPYYSISRITKRAGEDVPSPGGAWNGLRPFKDEFVTLVNATLHEVAGGNDYGDYFTPYNSDYKYPSYIATLPLRKTSEVNDSITSAANFYIVARLKLDELEVVTEAPVDMEDGTLIGLLGRRTMPDDYHSHDTLKASLMYGFNGRMNFAGVERTPHNPLSPAIQFAQSAIIGGSPQKQVAVSIKNDMQTLVVQSGQGYCSQEFPHWVFYPDANAKTAYVKHAGNTYELALTPHELLNGAYWLGDIAKQDVTPASTVQAPTITTGPFIEQNKVYTSNPYNPFVFEPTNINAVGTGKILGLCAAVKPLADDQYGKAPLYVFSTEGIWAMDTTTTGTYGSVWPLPRDVLSKIGDNYNAASITQLDDAVLFATDKGIMMLSGSTSQCITDAINSESPFKFSDLFTTEAAMTQWTTFLTANGYSTAGLTQVPFSTFLAGCRMIYDYVHQRIIVFNSSYNYAYVYSLKDHKWGMMTTNIDYGINSYPEALAVTDNNVLVNLSIDKTVEVTPAVAPATEPTTTPIKVKGLLVTRPLKLDQPDALKTIDTIIQRGKFDFLKPGRTVKPIRSILFGSRDLYNWFLISSSTDHYLRGFSGTPYKYFRIVALVDFLPDESVYGATIQYKPRYLNRPR